MSERDKRVPAAVRLAELEEVEATVEKLVAGGEGLARFEGIPLFVPRAVPGDRLRLRLVERHPDYGRAEIVEVLEPGSGRREPPCPYFARCGGCDLQQIEDPLQVELKAAAVRETLERLAGIPWPEQVEVVSGAAWGYRLRTQLHVEAPAGAEPAEAGGADRAAAAGEAPDPAVEPPAPVDRPLMGPAVGPAAARGAAPPEAEVPEAPATGPVRVGYHARRSNDLVAVDRCPILVPELEAALRRLPELLADDPPHRLDLAAGGDGRLTAAPRRRQLPHGEVQLTAAGFTYAYDARTFFQAHRGLVERLVEAVVGEEEGEVACDLYAGVGLFSLPLARRYGRVVAVEGDRVAARFARNNARRNRVGNLELVAQAVETWVRQLPVGIDRVVVDPPRSGLSKSVTKAIFRRRPRRLTYVSCHAAALARDLKRLSRAYRLDSLVLLDLFPQTGHMEVVAQLAAAEDAAPPDGDATTG